MLPENAPVATNASQVDILFGQGDGSFQITSGPFKTSQRIGVRPGPLAIGDLNGDSQDDLVFSLDVDPMPVRVSLGRYQ